MTDSPKKELTQKENPILVRIAFGAVIGAVVGLMVNPLLERLPKIPLVSAFIETLASEILSVALVAIGIFISARIQRLDKFLESHLGFLATILSIIFTAALWVNADLPMNASSVVVLLLTLLLCRFFLLYCGAVVKASMHNLTADQADDYLHRREKEAKSIAGEAIKAGDPQLAVGVFAIDFAGRAGQAMREGCYGCVMIVFFGVGTLLMATADAHVLYNLSLGWSLPIGAVITTAVLGLFGLSDKIGGAHADQIPVEEKYENILPREPEERNDE